jgi:hypothetical protein
MLAYPSEPTGTPNYGRLTALPTNIRLGWKSLPGANTPVYYKNHIVWIKKFYYIGSRGQDWS